MYVVCMYGNNMCVVAAKVALLTGFPGDGSSRIPDGKGQKKKKKNICICTCCTWEPY